MNTGRLDVVGWSGIILMKMSEGLLRFLIMGGMVEALLFIFTGPIMEGLFSFIINSVMVRINIET